MMESIGYTSKDHIMMTYLLRRQHLNITGVYLKENDYHQKEITLEQKMTN